MASSPRTQAYISGVIPYHRTRAGRNTSQVKDTLIAEIEKQHQPGLIPCKPRVHCATQTETDLKSSAQLKQKWDLFSLVAIGVSVEQQEHLWRLQPCKSKRTPLKEEVKKAKRKEQSAKSVPQLTHILLCLWVSRSNWDVFKVVFGNQTARCSRVANASSKKETQKQRCSWLSVWQRYINPGSRGNIRHRATLLSEHKFKTASCLFFLSMSPHLNDSSIFFKCFSSFRLVL